MPKKHPLGHWRPIEEVLPQRADRNYNKVHQAKIRLEIEAPFNALHDELEECYYKHWRQGQSAPFFGYDLMGTGEESKVLFDKLHGLIFHCLEILKFQKGALTDKPEESFAYTRRMAAQGLDIRPALEALSPFHLEL